MFAERLHNPDHQHPLIVRRCVVDLFDTLGDRDRAFAICQSTMQKAGYFKSDGSLSVKGRQREAQMRELPDTPAYEARYEAIVEGETGYRQQNVKHQVTLMLLSAVIGVITAKILSGGNHGASK